MQLKDGSQLQNGKYRILRVLGQGGFGITYLAHHSMLDKEVAIKEFFPKEYCDRDEPTSQLTIGSKNSVEIVDLLKNKFIKEARNISKLHHQNIITIHDIFEENGTAYYVMEYVEGPSLSDIIKRNGALNEKNGLEFIRKIADAVSYMHSLSMNHLDIKPANIMIREKDGEPILIDFGLSKQYDASGGQTSTTPVGISHGYAPAEQYRPGGVATFTPQTDVYALGATLFTLLTGTIPPHYSEILDDGLPPLPSSISSQTSAAIEHAMQVSKNKRPATISEFVEDLPDSIHNSQCEDSVKVVKENRKEETNNEDWETEATRLVNSFESYHHSSLGHKRQIFKNDNGNNIEIENENFIDLGLSVKWAERNIGACSIVDPGKYFDKGPASDNFEIYEWNLKGAKVPSAIHFRELIEKCTWEWLDHNNFYGYKVTGPNGNFILFQVTGEGSMNKEDFNKTNYGILWTNEAINKEYSSSSMVFYFNPFTYKLIYYPSYNKRPIRLITE